MSVELFGRRRFLPLFLTQFQGAFNDNFLKFAMILLVTFGVSSRNGSGEDTVFTSLAAALFILPYFLFSAFAGQLADKIDRARLTHYVKLFEVLLMAAAAAGLYFHWFNWLLGVLFLMGMQSTFFSPLKYSLLPQQLQDDELLAGNSFIASGTMLAVLLGTLCSVVVRQEYGELIVGGILVGLAGLGYYTSLWIPPAPAPVPALKLNYNLFYETGQILRSCYRQKVVFRCILGSSAFWLIGTIYTAQLSIFCRDYLHGGEGVVALFLTLFSVGVTCGAVLCNRLLKGVIQTTFVPLGALGMALFSFLLFAAATRLQVAPGPEDNGLYALSWFPEQFWFWRIAFYFFMLAVSAGLFLIPLDSLMQNRAEKKELARVIAGNNIVNSAFMAGGCLVVAGCTMLFGVSLATIFLLVAIFALVTAFYVCQLLPDALLRSLMRALLGAWFRVKVEGFEHFERAGSRVLLIANHQSLLDGVLIAAFMPEKLTFAINTEMARKWWVRPLAAMVDAYPVDPTSPLAARSLIQELRRDRKVMIFPEGRITVTGGLMKVYDGPGLIADKSGAMILPIRIDGAQHSLFSYLRHKVRTRLAPQITLTILPPRRFAVSPELTGRARRHAVSDGIYQIMTGMLYQCAAKKEHLFNALLRSERENGRHLPIAEDIQRKVLSMRQLINRSYLLGQLIARELPEERYIGLMLPNSLAAVIGFFGMQSADKVPALINFTSGPAMIEAGCRAVGIRTIVTAHKFIEQANYARLTADLTAKGIRLLYLEELTVGRTGAKLAGLCRSWFRRKARNDPDTPAAVLFTSGSEGTPKAVVLSHHNLQANRQQVLNVVAITRNDRLFNCLPMFHSFGLGMGTVMPILSGIRTFFYPSPLHYRIVAALSYDTNATILFGTDTFLSGYGRVAHPYDFFNVRFAMCGAEKLREATYRLWMDKFGVRICEGYGATEASPVISANTPMYYRYGTVGRPMPGLECRLEPVPGVTEGGRLFIRGENVMLGYMLAEQPGVLQPPPDGWYDTGDIVSIDADGFLKICGRAKRFAKIGGEMVSLGAVENLVMRCYPGAAHAVVAVDDPVKGEQLVLVTEAVAAAASTLVGYFRENGLSELWAPRKILVVKEVPRLGSGKVDYPAVRRLAGEAG